MVNLSDTIDHWPTVLVFDLDDTIWRGEVDCSGGPPFHRKDSHTVHCASGRPVTLFEDIPRIFFELISHEVPEVVMVAYASRTWEPKWAQQALSEFVNVEGNKNASDNRIVNMWTIAAAHGWGDCKKTHHLAEIQKQTNKKVKDMVFFDNDYRNFKDVKHLGIHEGYCPDGLSEGIFVKTLQQYSENVRRAS